MSQIVKKGNTVFNKKITTTAQFSPEKARSGVVTLSEEQQGAAAIIREFTHSLHCPESSFGSTSAVCTSLTCEWLAWDVAEALEVAGLIARGRNKSMGESQ